MGCLLQWTLLFAVLLFLPSLSTAQGKDLCTISGSGIQMNMFSGVILTLSAACAVLI